MSGPTQDGEVLRLHPRRSKGVAMLVLEYFVVIMIAVLAIAGFLASTRLG